MRDTYLIFRHQLSMSLRGPLWMVVGLLQPQVYIPGLQLRLLWMSATLVAQCN